MSSIRPAFATCSLRHAERYLHARLWNGGIHAEWMRSLLADPPDIEAGLLDRTHAVMDGDFPGAVVTGRKALAATVGPYEPDGRLSGHPGTARLSLSRRRETAI